MQGYEIVVYEGATLDPDFKNPVGADNIRSFWEPTRARAERALSDLQQAFDGVVQLE